MGPLVGVMLAPEVVLNFDEVAKIWSLGRMNECIVTL